MTEFTYSFVLKEKSSPRETPIILIIRYRYERIKYYTGEKVLPKWWKKYYKSEEDQKRLIYDTENNKEIRKQLSGINSQLGRYRDKADTLNGYLKQQKIEPSFDFIKSEFDKEFLKTPRLLAFQKTSSQGNNQMTPHAPGMDLFSFIDEFIKTTNRRGSTLVVYKTTQMHLKEYKKKMNKKINFEDIDLAFYDSFVKYLQNKKRPVPKKVKDGEEEKKDEGYALNTIGKYIKTIKTFMSNAEDRGLHHNTFYRNKRFKVTSEDSDSIYLNTGELGKIYKLDLSKEPTLEKVRDLFIVDCWTGLRFSDLAELSMDNIVKTDMGNLIKIKTVKNSEPVAIPIHDTINRILKKYKNSLPPVLSNQKMNEHLKEIGEKAEIDEPVELVITKGGLRRKKTFKKYDLITCHTARRSFATNMYMADIPAISIMKITGHRTEKAFLRYIKISAEDNAKKLLQHPLFRQIV